MNKSKQIEQKHHIIQTDCESQTTDLYNCIKDLRQKNFALTLEIKELKQSKQTLEQRVCSLEDQIKQINKIIYNK